MSLSSTRALVAAAVLAGATLVSVAPAGAGITTDLVTEPTFNRGEPEFTFGADGDEPSCSGRSASVSGPDGEVDPETTVAFDTSLSGTFTPGDGAAGYYQLTIECQNGEFPVTYTADFAFARLTVEKVVEGTAPAATAFTVEADCVSEGGEGYDFTEDLEFPAAGGVQDVILYGGALCTTSETDDGGATSSSVDDAETDFGPAPVDLTSTVTNVFAAAPPEPTPEPTPEPPAVEPAVAEPTFTG